MRKLTDIQHYQDIADAIRAKNGTAGTMKPEDMAAAISGINTGGETVKTYTFDKMLLGDAVVQALPAYGTTEQTVLAADVIEDVELDQSRYHYLLCRRALAIPEYSVDTRGAGRAEYTMWSDVSYVFVLREGMFKGLDGETIAAMSATAATTRIYRQITAYWNSSGNLAVQSSGCYGVYCNFGTAPTAVTPADTLTVKTPDIILRGSSTCFKETYYDALTDVRIQYVIELKRIGRNDGNTDPFKQILHTAECAAAPGHKLT